MYAVQVRTMPRPVSTTSTPRPCWNDHTVVEQMETEQAELNEARAVARILSAFYHEVRVVKYAPGGFGFEVVR
jgi:hypothetical protein